MDLRQPVAIESVLGNGSSAVLLRRPRCAVLALCCTRCAILALHCTSALAPAATDVDLKHPLNDEISRRGSTLLFCLSNHLIQISQHYHLAVTLSQRSHRKRELPIK
jgi:hypothetical protein